MSDQIRARIFVVGCPRSGTTLLQGLIGGHPRIRAFPESHFFARMTGRPDDEADRHVDDFLRSCGIEVGTEPAGTRPVDRLIAALDAAALKVGAEMWSEKTPRHLHHIEDIEAAVPSPRFVHILRDGADVVASLHRVTHEFPEHWGGKPRSIGRCIRRWQFDVDVSLGYLGHRLHHFVRYERLIDRTERVLESLCDFLGIDMDARMLTPQQDVVSAISGAHETWKARASEPVGGTSRSDQRDDIAEALAPTQTLLDDALPRSD